MNARTAHSGANTTTLAAYLLLALALAATAACCLPQHALAADSSADATTDANTTDTDTSTDTEEAVSTSHSYDLDIALSTKTTSGKKNIVKTVRVTKPVLTTTTTATYASGATSTSTKSTAYGLAVKVYVNGVGWKKATLNSAGSAYTYTAAKAASGAFITAVKIAPTTALKKAMRTAGVTFAYRAKSQGFGTLSWALPGSTAGTTGNNAALKSLQLKVLSTGAAAKLNTSTPYISKTTISIKTAKKDGTITGFSASVSSNVSGGISYTVYAGSKKDTARNGRKAKVGGKAITCVKVKLTGELAGYYNVCYRTHFHNRLWMKWAKNGKLAGTKDTSLLMNKVDVKIRKTRASAPSGGYHTAYSKTSKLVPLSGDKVLDAKIYSISHSRTLRECYRWIIANGSRGASRTRVYTSIRRSWMIKEAKLLLISGNTDCYGMSSSFYWCAKAKNYDVREVCGTVPRRSGGRAAHSWVEINVDGVWHCYDPDLGRSYPTRNFYNFTMDAAPTSYTRLYV